MRILALLDGSSLDHDVLLSTRRLAQSGDRVLLYSVILRHQVPGVSGNGVPRDGDRPETVDFTAKRTLELHMLAAQYLPELEVTVDVDIARVRSAQVLHVARLCDVAVIVIGIHRDDPVEHVAGRSLAAALIQAAELPVIAVPQGIPWPAAWTSERPAPALLRRPGRAVDAAALMQGLRSPAFALDAQARVCAINAAAVEAFEVDPRRVFAQPCYQVLRPLGADEQRHCNASCPLLARVRQGDPIMFPPHTWRLHGGPVRPFRAATVTIPPALRGTPGGPALLVAVLPETE